MSPRPDQQCLNTALRLLGRRDHSAAELNRKLSQRGFSSGQIAPVIAECKRMRYLDDAKFCQLYTLQQRRKGYGILRIAQKLKAKGLSARQIDASLSRNCSEMDQVEDCRRVLTKKLRSCSPGNGGSMTERLYRFLLNRGFTTATIFKVLGEP